MAHHASRDYTKLAKTGFFLGVALFALGGLGEIVGSAAFGGLPGWEQTLLFDMEVLGIALGLFSPFLFGVVAPLVE
ncbi:hypothetical protein C475_16451 [Halosimplex carlsbadense 2-9-1]|uniref:Uncharacterized protein n=1 Tax=Halosimplex carlsbadense 2-9-1 TaxID=797114 RepID=M0CHD9_9EURY|nr:hypothetical protein [Halosimplex carlsbadense]ELZ22710.1 hypothetical protein C475_16451 [Halosimplex carlsbadense 2-9-1]